MVAVPAAVQAFRRVRRIWIPFIVIGELRAGFAVRKKGKENERVFEQFLHRERVELLMPTMETTRSYAQLFRQFREAGTSIPKNDIWIAAIKIQHNLYLYSRDEHFNALPQILRI